MRQPLFSLWLAAALAGGFFTGCGPARRPYLDDPFLASRKPVDGKPAAEEAVQVAFAEPVPPAASPLALAALPTRPPRPLLEDLPMPADTVAERGPANHAPSTVAALPVVRRRLAGPYGRAPDYSWLQGILGQRAGGECELRYADPADPDAHGGKVRLIEDPRLDAFRPGDVLWVTGEFVPESDQPAEVASNPSPRYRVRAVCLAHPAQVPPQPRSNY